MKLYVPEIGDRLVLSSDWKFKLYHEHRNQSLFDYFKKTLSYSYPVMRYDEVTLPKDTVLRVDRIYIRKGAVEYSSISFVAEGIGGKKGSRFWAKLDDCNKIEFEVSSLKDRAKIGLWWNVPEVKKKDGSHLYRSPYKSINEYVSKSGFVSENGNWNEADSLYSVKVTYNEFRELVREETRTEGGLFGIPIRTYKSYFYKIERPDLEYSVTTKDGTHIGTFTSYSGMQKAIREHYNAS